VPIGSATMTELQPDPRLRTARAAHGRGARRRLVALGSLLVVFVAIVAVVVVTLRKSAPTGTATPPRATHHGGRPASGPVARVTQVGTLASAISGAGAAPSGADGAILVGGLDSANTPIDTIQSFDGSRTRSVGTLPDPVGSPAEALLDKVIYLFGGADSSGLPSSSIVSVTSDGASSTIVGQLPQATSGAAAASADGTAYIFGGADSTGDLDSILSFTASAGAASVGTLPGALSDATAVSYGGNIYVIGGAVGKQAIRSIYRFDPLAKSVTKIAELPVALSAAASASIGKELVVFGGDRTVGASTSDAILGINPASGKVTTLGKLPVALAGAVAVSLPGAALVMGGVEPDGQANSAIYRVQIVAHAARSARKRGG
jgi:N-acetylneuraminic acid mutarotase